MPVSDKRDTFSASSASECGLQRSSGELIEKDTAAWPAAASHRIDIRLYEDSLEVLHKESLCLEDDRHETKNELKRLLYRILAEYSGKTLPWGNLTGIRPTKIPMALLNQGFKNSEIADYMRKTYYTSNEKTALAITIANREHSLLEKLKPEKHASQAGGGRHFAADTACTSVFLSARASVCTARSAPVRSRSGAIRSMTI